MAEMTPLSDSDAQKLDSLVALLSAPKPNAEVPKEVFHFNPNKVSEAELSRLGFSERVVRQLVNYRSKGGIFRIKDDLYKIYAIDSGLVNSLYAYIDLPISLKSKRSTPKKVEEPKKEAGMLRMARKPSPKPEKFDLNRADTAMLQTVYGIGSVLSKRLVSFRNKLGGFVSEKQLYEVYNLDSVVIDSLLAVSFLAQSDNNRKILINSFTDKELAAHPYISWQQARLIVAYRNQHGDFREEADLLQVYLLEDNDINRLAPYLQFD